MQMLADGFLSKFYLHRSARGAGTGRVAMEFIERLARQRGLDLIWLTVNKGNPAVNACQHRSEKALT